MRFAAMLLALCCSANAQSGKIPVIVDSTGDDTVGSRLAYQVRGQIAQSALFREPKGKELYLKVHLVTLDPDSSIESTRGSRTIYAMSLTIVGPIANDEKYLTTTVGKCGTSVVARCAESILSDLVKYK